MSIATNLGQSRGREGRIQLSLGKVAIGQAGAHAVWGVAMHNQNQIETQAFVRCSSVLVQGDIVSWSSVVHAEEVVSGRHCGPTAICE